MKIPAVLVSMKQYLADNGAFSLQGIFRLSGNGSARDELIGKGMSRRRLW
jgi:hypothetical protein